MGTYSLTLILPTRRDPALQCQARVSCSLEILISVFRVSACAQPPLSNQATFLPLSPTPALHFTFSLSLSASPSRRLSLLSRKIKRPRKKQRETGQRQRDAERKVLLLPAVEKHKKNEKQAVAQRRLLLFSLSLCLSLGLWSRNICGRRRQSFKKLPRTTTRLARTSLKTCGRYTGTEGEKKRNKGGTQWGGWADRRVTRASGARTKKSMLKRFLSVFPGSLAVKYRRY